MKLVRRLILLLLIVSALNAEPYVTAKLNGQLGNQLYQVATAISLALDNDAEAIFPEFTTRKDVGIPLNKELVFYRVNMGDLPTPIETTWEEPKHTYVPIKYTPNMQIEGFFQSYKYFDKHREYLINLFAPPKQFIEDLKKRYSKMLSHPNTVAIHIRTYHNCPVRSNFAKCEKRYVKAAIKHFPKDAQFIVFSDNIPWCRKKLSKLAKNMIFMEGNSYIEDFYLISLCKHQIISNSTFSWWAAYLNQHPDKKIVAPKRWFGTRREHDNHDIVPDDWIMVDNIKG